MSLASFAGCAGLLVLLLVPQAAVQLPDLPAGVPPNARLYVRPAGAQPGRMAAWRGRDGTVEVIYRYRHADACLTDIRSTISLDVVGAIVGLKHAGQTCQPSQPLRETYTRSGSLGIWQGPQGRGEGDVIGKKFFTSAVSVPEERALLVRALLAAGNRVELLPAGEAVLEEGRTLTLTSGGQQERVTLYRITGLRTGPSSVWLDSRMELFALDGELVRQGWEASLPELRRAQ